MISKLSLAQYVKKRNGVPLGASGSMTNMLSRSFGAASFPIFWHYWNPIWGYYLSRNVMSPLASFLPFSLATFLTFLVSGALDTKQDRHVYVYPLIHMKRNEL